ncbi:MAG TPA: glycosyl hydrolase family 79 C-terminal domain-containing protein [Solirubrobacteraceae bacterium]
MSRSPRRRLVAGSAITALALVVAAVLISAGTGDPSLPALPASANASAQGALRVTLSTAAPARRVPPGFLGLSIEFQAIRDYTGTDPQRVNPLLVTLIRQLSPGQRPVLRIGGDSTDVTWVPGPGVKAPNYESYPLTPGWLATTAALARELNARMTLGINLAANQPALAAAEARAYLHSIGRRQIAALEIGNEPNLYGKIPELKLGSRRVRRARPRSYDYARFAKDFGAIAAVLPPMPLAGPALALGPRLDPGTWPDSIGRLLAAHPRLQMLSVHRYPLRNCYVGPRSRQYPTVPHLLSSYATTTLGRGLRRWIQIAHSHGRRLRLDELNSVACRGRAGVSDTFASALWVTDALFTLARAGVDGINMHTLPNAAYELFRFSHAGPRWSAYVQPVYYGLQLFARAAPAGAQLLAGSGPIATTGISVWATRGPDGREQVALVNESPSRTRAVSLRMPAGTGGTAAVTRLMAASVYARTGVTWGGRGYGAATTTGRLGVPRTQTLTARGGAYTLAVPHGSAALVTFPR